MAVCCAYECAVVAGVDSELLVAEHADHQRTEGTRMLTEFSLPLVSGVEKADAGQPGRDDLERVAWAAADSAGWAG